MQNDMNIYTYYYFILRLYSNHRGLTYLQLAKQPFCFQLGSIHQILHFTLYQTLRRIMMQITQHQPNKFVIYLFVCCFTICTSIYPGWWSYRLIVRQTELCDIHQYLIYVSQYSECLKFNKCSKLIDTIWCLECYAWFFIRYK